VSGPGADELAALFDAPMSADAELDLSGETDVIAACQALEDKLAALDGGPAGSLRVICDPAGPEDEGLFMPLAQHIRLLKRAGRVARALPLAGEAAIGFHISLEPSPAP